MALLSSVFRRPSTTVSLAVRTLGPCRSFDRGLFSFHRSFKRMFAEDKEPSPAPKGTEPTGYGFYKLQEYDFEKGEYCKAKCSESKRSSAEEEKPSPARKVGYASWTFPVPEPGTGYVVDLDDNGQCRLSVGEVADGFPFEIVDNAGEQTIMLRREFDGEVIRVAVDIPNVSPMEDNDDDDEEDEDNGIPMVVSVSKGNGMELEFGLTAFTDEICIDSLLTRQPEDSEGSKRDAYEGPNFSDLDKSFQKAFEKYLEIRGIKPSITKFLLEYMKNKDYREYLLWLKNLKGFIEE